MLRSSSTRNLICVTALALLVQAPTSEAATGLEITVNGAAGASPAGNDGDFYGIETVSSSGPSISFVDSASSPDGSASSSGSVGFGWARSLAAASHSSEPETNGGSSATTQSLFRDELTITSPGLSGGGTVTFLIEVSGSLGALFSGLFAGADSDFNTFARASTAPVKPTRIAEGTYSVSDSGVFQTGDQTGGMYEWGPIPFAFGFPFEITIALNATADVNRCCSAIAAFDSTLTWEGVVEIRDGADALVSDFMISSGSGANYGEPIPVPEPAGVAMALASLMTTALLIRARRSAA